MKKHTTISILPLLLLLLLQISEASNNYGAAGHTPYQTTCLHSSPNSPVTFNSLPKPKLPAVKRKLHELYSSFHCKDETEIGQLMRVAFPQICTSNTVFKTPPLIPQNPEAPSSNDSVSSFGSSSFACGSRASAYTTESVSASMCSRTSATASTCSSVGFHSTVFSSVPRNIFVSSIESNSHALHYSDNHSDAFTSINSEPRVDPHGYREFFQELNDEGMRCNSAVFFEESADKAFVDMLMQLCDDGTATPTSVAASVMRVDRPPSITLELSKELLKASLDPGNEKNLEAVNSTFERRQSTSTPPIPQTAEAIEQEYRPWIPSSTTRAFMSEPFTALKEDFDLPPFLASKTAALDEPETEADKSYFRDADFKPFQDYGELFEDENKMKGALESVRDEVVRVSDSISESHQKYLKTKKMGSSSSRHAAINSFIKNNKHLTESEWLKMVLRGESVDFFQFYANSTDLSLWTVTRCRQFIVVVIPSIVYSPHLEEVLLDFLNDFFLPHIVKSANAAMRTETDRNNLSSELTKIAVEMIKELITPVIFDKFVSYIQPVITQNHADLLYETLVETMKTFKVPRKYVPEELTLPLKPSHKDAKYKTFKALDAKLKAFKADMENYQTEIDILKAKLERNNDRKAAFQADLIRVKKIHKSRSFDYLKCLVTNFGDPIMRPDSRWIKGIYLDMPKDVTGVDDVVDTDELTSPVRAAMGPDAHENQDFFDALFFSRILRACLVLDHTINFVAIHLDPFLKSYQIDQIDTRIGFRYLIAVNRFIKITRFNVVANVLPQLINYRRYLLAYLTRNGATYMGIETKKVQSRAITFELLSLFESLHLYQMYTVNSTEYHADRFEAIFSVKNLEFNIPIIYLAYNPLSYPTISRIMKDSGLSKSRVGAYMEIFAAMNNVELLPMLQRKVLRFKSTLKDPNDPFNHLDSINQQLSKDYDAVYNWSMSKALKDLRKISVHLHYSYALFAARALLARRFGVSFDASNHLAQLKENFEWLESIDFINFFLEREAQILISRANPMIDCSDSYQVYRVQDPQKHLHLQRQLPSDEPTHHINLLIERAFSQLPQEEIESFRSTFKGDTLFNILRHRIGNDNPQIVMNWPAKFAVTILRTILEEQRILESSESNIPSSPKDE